MENSKDVITPKSRGNAKVLLKALVRELTYQRHHALICTTASVTLGFQGDTELHIVTLACFMLYSLNKDEGSPHNLLFMKYSQIKDS